MPHCPPPCSYPDPPWWPGVAAYPTHHAAGALPPSHLSRLSLRRWIGPAACAFASTVSAEGRNRLTSTNAQPRRRRRPPRRNHHHWMISLHDSESPTLLLVRSLRPYRPHHLHRPIRPCHPHPPHHSHHPHHHSHHPHQRHLCHLRPSHHHCQHCARPATVNPNRRCRARKTHDPLFPPLPQHQGTASLTVLVAVPEIAPLVCPFGYRPPPHRRRHLLSPPRPPRPPRPLPPLPRKAASPTMPGTLQSLSSHCEHRPFRPSQSSCRHFPNDAVALSCAPPYRRRRCRRRCRRRP